MAIIVSNQIYIGYQERAEGDWKTPMKDRKQTLLGFATYYEENAAFEKRKNTIDSWAQGNYWNRKEKVIPAEIIDNELLSGFKLSREVRRSASWGGGNVLWRIEDPRGFELEISSANLAAIMGCSTIVNGEIQGKCKWGWNTTGGSKVVLLPEHSDPYKQALEDTKRRNSNVSWKDVNIGDKVELKNGTVAVYYGYHHYLKTDYGEDYDGYSYNYHRSPRVWKASKRKSHFFRLPGNHQILMVSSPKAAAILETTMKEITNEEGAERINKALRDGFKTGSPSYDNIEINFVSPTPIKESDWEIVLRPMKASALEDCITNPIGYNAPKIQKSSNVALSLCDVFYLIDWVDNKGNIHIEEIHKNKLLNERCRENVVTERQRPPQDRFTYGLRNTTLVEPNKKKIDLAAARVASAEKIFIEYNNQQYPIKF